MANNDAYLQLGNSISLAAAILILAVLAELVLNGLKAIYLPWVLSVMWILWIMGIAAYVSYVSAELRVRQLMVYTVPLALAITLVGLILLTEHKFLGAELVVLGYFLEPIAGVSLYLRLLSINGPAAHAFFWGAFLFTVGLPLILIKDAYVSLIGDLIKMMSLMLLILRSK